VRSGFFFGWAFFDVLNLFSPIYLSSFWIFISHLPLSKFAIHSLLHVSISIHTAYPHTAFTEYHGPLLQARFLGYYIQLSLRLLNWLPFSHTVSYHPFSLLLLPFSLSLELLSKRYIFPAIFFLLSRHQYPPLGRTFWRVFIEL